MPIRPSSSTAIRALIAALDGPDEVQRESAVARLAVIGPRAVEHLLAAFPHTSHPAQRTGILRALETIADPRALPLARSAVDDAAPETCTAALSVLRALASGASGAAAREALDVLIAAALDRGRPAAARLAALDALRDMPASVLDPVRRALADDPDPQMAARGAAGRGRTTAVDSAWREAVEGRLPSSPAALKQALQRADTSASLSELQRLVDHLRATETREPDQARRAEWRVVRGAVHQALAARGSRLALYDLRDSLMLEPGPLPVAFLAAVEDIGDASCIEPLAAAYDSSSRSGDAWWREHVGAAFRAILRREGLTRRHLVVKRAMARWPDATAALMARS